MTDPRYPIGRFQAPDSFTEATRAAALEELASAPARLRAALAGLDERRLDVPYRDGGWTARQVVHHLADSHLNAYVRHKLAWAEERPTIRPYDETAWAESAEARTAPVELSLALLDALHRRWVAFLRGLPAESFAREFFHPEAKRWMSLDWSVAMYAWHGRHHTGHVEIVAAGRGG